MTSNTRVEDVDMSVDNMDEEPVPSSDLTALGSARCSVCDQSAIGRCPRCRNMWYCSKKCIQTSKRSHLALCRSYTELSDRPAHQSRSYFRGIFFPAGEIFPRFVWLEYFGIRNFFPNPVQIGELLEGGSETYRRFDCHRELRRSLGYQVEMLYGIQPDNNEALKLLFPDISANHWDGSFLARGFNSSNGTPGDLDTNAVPAILAFLVWMGSHHSLYPGKVYALDTVMGDEFDPPE